MPSPSIYKSQENTSAAKQGGVKNGFNGVNRRTFGRNWNLNDTFGGGVHLCASVLLIVDNWDYKHLIERLE